MQACIDVYDVFGLSVCADVASLGLCCVLKLAFSFVVTYRIAWGTLNQSGRRWGHGGTREYGGA